MKQLILTLIIALPISAFAGHIQDVNDELMQISIANSQCNHNAMSNYEMKVCSGAMGADLDVLLNKEYKAIVNNKSNFNYDETPETMKALEETFRESQRKWLKFRESNCDWQSTAMYGGTGQSLIYSGCSNRMTKNRIKEMVEHYYFDM